MANYVDITRYFRNVDDEPTSPLARRMLRSIGNESGMTWETLLDAGSLEPLVLVAPSGTGKSTEFRQQAMKLRSLGRHAVYAEAIAVIAGLEQGLSPDEHKAYKMWRNSVDPLILLVDAVDELHIRQRKLEDLLRQLGRDIDIATRKVRFVLSARTGAWTSSSSQRLVAFTRIDSDKQLKIIAFDPIDEEALQRLAIASNVDKVNDFMRVFFDEEIETLWDLRPADVDRLVAMWNRNRQFGGWTEVLLELIDTSSVETDPVRGQSRVLCPSETSTGLQRMAAATLLTKTSLVAAPTVAQDFTAVSSRRLFEDWPIAKVIELFENPSLIHKGQDAEVAQIPDGPLHHFLAARWLIARAQGGWPIESLRDALLVRVFEEKGYRIPEPHLGVVGWVASGIADFRRLLVEEHPTVVLYEGDPDKLSDGEIEEGLGFLCAWLSERTLPWSLPSVATVRKLARPAVEPTVKRLIDKYSKRLLNGDKNTVEVLRHLLRMAIAGCYRSCVGKASILAHNASVDSEVRVKAIDIVARAGESGQRVTLLTLISDIESRVRLALLRALVPDLLEGQQLIDLICTGGDDSFPYELAEIAERISCSDLDACLSRLREKFSGDVIDTDTKSAFEVALPIVVARLKKGNQIPAHVVDVLFDVERFSELFGCDLSHQVKKSIDTFLRENSNIRRSLWRIRIAASELDSRMYSFLMEPSFGDALIEDLSWLWEAFADRSRARSVIDRLWARILTEARTRVLAEVPESLRNHLNGLTHNEKEWQERQRKYEDKKRRKEEDIRAKNQVALAPRLAEIESGNDLDALVRAWADVASELRTRGDLDLTRLRVHVGEEYVEVFRRGFVACWRKQDVPIPVPGSNTYPVQYAVGLSGLDIEARSGLDFASLSAIDADRAARYAFYELNGFPFWFADLLQAHPDVVNKVLAEAIVADWDYPDEHHGVLRFAPYSEESVANALRCVALNLLRSKAPASLQVTRDAVSALLTSFSDRELVSKLAAREIERTKDLFDELPEWLRLAAHVEPARTARWIKERRTKNVSMEQVVLRVAELLEQDLDGRLERTAATNLMNPSSLEEWIRVVLRAVRPEDDAKHEGMHVVGTREQAEHFRDRCLSRLARDPSMEAHEVLRSLLEDGELERHREMFERMLEAQKRSAANAAVPRWTEEDVLRVERCDEKLPRSLDELFKLVLRHIGDVARLIENDDFSYRDLFKKDTDERAIQLWAASCLRDRSRGLYSVVRENVVDKNKKVDVSAFAPGIGHIPIEIKPLGRYSPRQLEKTIYDQLLGRYMQPPDRRCGVLLLVRRERKHWTLNGKRRDIAALRTWLRERARKIYERRGKDVQVALIDLRACPPITGKNEQVLSKQPKATGTTRRLQSRAKASKSRRRTRTHSEQ